MIFQIACAEPLLQVYDVTNFLDEHPGGDEVLLLAVGKIMHCLVVSLDEKHYMTWKGLQVYHLHMLQRKMPLKTLKTWDTVIMQGQWWNNTTWAKLMCQPYRRSLTTSHLNKRQWPHLHKATSLLVVQWRSCNFLCPCWSWDWHILCNTCVKKTSSIIQSLGNLSLSLKL